MNPDIPGTSIMGAVAACGGTAFMCLITLVIIVNNRQLTPTISSVDSKCTLAEWARGQVLSPSCKPPVCVHIPVLHVPPHCHVCAAHWHVCAAHCHVCAAHCHVCASLCHDRATYSWPQQSFDAIIRRGEEKSLAR